MSNLQTSLIKNKPNTSIFLVDIKCKACGTVTRAADLVFSADRNIGMENIINATFKCSGCNTLQPYIVKDILRANRAGRMTDHMIEAFPTTQKHLKMDLWINSHTNKMLFVQNSVRTFTNVQNTLYIPLADKLDLIELRNQLKCELDFNSDVPAVVQRLLKQWGAIHPFMLTMDEIEQPGALFDVCQLMIEKSDFKLKAYRTFIGPKLHRKAYFLDNDHINLLTDPHVFNNCIAVTCISDRKMIFYGGKCLYLFVVVQASDSWLKGKFIEAEWDEETQTCTPLAIYNDRPHVLV